MEQTNLEKRHWLWLFPAVAVAFPLLLWISAQPANTPLWQGGIARQVALNLLMIAHGTTGKFLIAALFCLPGLITLFLQPKTDLSQSAHPRFNLWLDRAVKIQLWLLLFTLIIVLSLIFLPVWRPVGLLSRLLSALTVLIMLLPITMPLTLLLGAYLKRLTGRYIAIIVGSFLLMIGGMTVTWHAFGCSYGTNMYGTCRKSADDPV